MTHRLYTLFILSLMAITMMAQEQVVMNKPYIDNRTLHWGFYVGMTMHDMELQNNGNIDPASGEQWYMDVNTFSPGFTVGVLGEWRINKYISLRLCPGISFGSKNIKFHEQFSGRDSTQVMKSNLIVMPIQAKISAPRYNNFRPYILAGLNPAINLGSKKDHALVAKGFDCYFEVGLGCDIYLRYFKLIPELKFSFGLLNVIQKDRPDIAETGTIKYTDGIGKSSSNMITLSFNFE